ncbi:MAG: ATP-binding domain-containing protein, partial [Stackebrandtia sp.]
MTDGVFGAWTTDVAAGCESVMVASTNTDVTTLSARARADRVGRGEVEDAGVGLADGNTAGVGDWIVTRDNDRRLILSSGQDFVRNGTTWTVRKRYADGSLKVTARNGNGTTVLPAAYVETSVELAYATTVHRVQGATVDTAHALITDEMAREHLYVAATRARHTTHLYAVTHQILPADPDARLDKLRWDTDAIAAREVLETIIAREGTEKSATETVRDTITDAESLATLVPRFQHALEAATRDHYTHTMTTVLGNSIADLITTDGAGPVVRALLAAEAAGWKPTDILDFAAAQGHLDNADIESPAAVLSARIRDLTETHTPPAPLAAPTRADAARYARLLRRHHRNWRLDPDLALTPPRTTDRREAVSIDTIVSTAQTREWATHLAGLLGTSAESVARHRAWPHLVTDIARAAAAGRDPLPLLTTTADGARPGNSDDPTAAIAPVARTIRHLTAASGTGAMPVLPPALRYQQAATRVFGPDKADQIQTTPAWAAVHNALYKAE